MLEGPNNNKKDNQEARKKVKQQIRATREYERKWRGIRGMAYDVNRSEGSYMIALKGFSKLFDYLKTRKITKVLDIGAGTGRAIDEISKSEEGQGLDFVGTTLAKNPKRESSQKIHITSAEVLRGIPSNSFGAVLAVFSVGYSDAPKLVAEQIDRILVPGGVFKGAFSPAGVGGIKYDENVMLKSYDRLYFALKEKGYDCATLMEIPAARRKIELDQILLAVKPDPASTPPPAKDLLQSDYLEFNSLFEGEKYRDL